MLKENSSIEMKKGENTIRQEKVNELEFDFNAGCKKSLKDFLSTSGPVCVTL